MSGETNDTGKTRKTTGSGFTPGITLDSTDGSSISAMTKASKVTPRAESTNESMAIGDANTTKEPEPQRLSMPKPTVATRKRATTKHKLDIADLGKKKDPNDVPGVNIFESPQKEVFKEGGPFEKYVEEKKAEMIERMAYEEDRRAVEELDAGESTEELSLEETIDKEDFELERDNQINTSKRMRVNAVFDDDEEEVAAEEDQVEESSNEPAPFYTSLGVEDDYDYDDNYDISKYVNEEDEEDDSMDEELREEFNPVEETSEEEIIEDEVEEIKDNTEETTVDVEPEVKAEEPVEEESMDEEQHDLRARHIAFTTDEESLEDLEKETNDSELPDEDERLEELKAEISRKVKPKARGLNLKGFTIASKSTASNKIFETREASAGKWILPTTGICVQMREISGQKIEYIREQASANTPTGNRNTLKTIYDHIVTPKPQSFEAWTKSIAFADYDHLFMPMYMAAFSDSNYMPQTCNMEKGKVPKVQTGCGKMFLSDNIDIMKLVKFKDDESKKKFWNLYNSDRTNSEGLYVSEIIPISNKFAIEFCEPTLYSVLFENGNFGREFNEKYENVISFMPYIGRIFWIDAKRSTLVPLSYKKYDNNANKTAKSKVIRYSNVLDSLSTDEYTAVVALISSINEKNDWFTYRIPEMTCPECGRTIPEEETTAAQLVFTRHRLGVLANTSIN